MAQIQHYDQGDVWVPQAAFTVGGTPTDPTTITVKVKEPDGTVTTMGPVSGGTGGGGITRVSAGLYTVNVTLDDAGYWFVRFEGTGAAAASEEQQAIVDPSEFYESAQLTGRALVTMAETRDWLNHLQQEAPEGLELSRVINDVSERMHYEAGREFRVLGTNPQVRLFPVDLWPDRFDPWYVDGEYVGELSPAARTVAVGDLATYTSVRILDRDWTTLVENVSLANITAHPLEVAPRVNPIRRLEFRDTVASIPRGGRVEVTGTWGFPAVPGDVRQATLDAVAAAVDRDVEHYSTELGPLQQQGAGTNVIVMGRSPRLLALPPSSLAVAWSYRDTFV